VTIEHRFADGYNERLPQLAAELVRLKVNVIFANTTPPALAAKAATMTIPIVFLTGVDPVELGLIASLNRPGPNVTGVTIWSNKLVAKRMELLSNLVPAGAPIGMLAAQRNPNTETDVKDALAAADALGRTLHVGKVKPEGDVDAAVAALIEQRVAGAGGAPCIADDLFERRLCKSRRPDELWGGSAGLLSPGRRLCRTHPQRREAG
jgi:putative tryptophan/tyrosine transport system substrate-binding protein